MTVSVADDRPADGGDAGGAPTRRVSAWVSANAGSGKTFVLSRRVIRLLLAGVDPARILCLTFTKAAAAEMANRVFAELGAWTTLADAELAERIAELEGGRPTPATLAAARRLFAAALDTPGGLKIQTIHAFCERLLHQFPFEANVAGHFEVLDERDADGADRRSAPRGAGARRGGARRRPRRGAGTVLSRPATTPMRSRSPSSSTSATVGAWIVCAGDLDGALARLRDVLGLCSGETAERVCEKVVNESLLAADARRLVDVLSRGGSNDMRAGKRLASYVEATDLDKRAKALIDYLIKDDGEPRSNSSVATQVIRRQSSRPSRSKSKKAAATLQRGSSVPVLAVVSSKVPSPRFRHI